jgi:hypothetical protein
MVRADAAVSAPEHVEYDLTHLRRADRGRLDRQNTSRGLQIRGPTSGIAEVERLVLTG